MKKLTGKDLRVVIESVISEARVVKPKETDMWNDILEFERASKSVEVLAARVEKTLTHFVNMLDRAEETGKIYDDLSELEAAVQDVAAALKSNAKDIKRLSKVYPRVIKALQTKKAKKALEKSPVEKPYTGGRHWHGNHGPTGQLKSKKSSESW